MLTYNLIYSHKTKEIILTFQVGSSPQVKLIMGAEASIQDFDFLKKDPKLAHFLFEVRKRKDLPIDYDFGTNAEIRFDPNDWEGKMKEE